MISRTAAGLLSGRTLSALAGAQRPGDRRNHWPVALQAGSPPSKSMTGETMGITFPAESPEYRAARDRLLDQEIELRRATEAVAAARRELPAGGVLPQDYVFQGAGADGSPADVRFSELFAPGKGSLVIYSMMF